MKLLDKSIQNYYRIKKTAHNLRRNKKLFSKSVISKRVHEKLFKYYKRQDIKVLENNYLELDECFVRSRFIEDKLLSVQKKKLL